MGAILYVLTWCLPPKYARKARKILWMAFFIFAIYIALFVYTLKSFNIEEQNGLMENDQVIFEFLFSNNSIFNMKILNVTFYDSSHKFLEKTNSFPIFLEAKKSINSNLIYDFGIYKNIDIELKALFKTITINLPIKKNK